MKPDERLPALAAVEDTSQAVRLTLIGLAWRGLRVRLSRTLLTLSAIVLGVAVIMGVSITNESTMASLTDVFTEASGRAQLVVVAANRDAGSFPDSVLRTIAQDKRVALAAPIVQGNALLSDQAPPEEVGISLFTGSMGENLLIHGVDPINDPQMRSYRLESGAMLDPNLDAYDILLGGEWAREQQIDVGQDIELRTSEGLYQLRVVGLLTKEGPGVLNNGAFGAVPLGTAQAMFGRGGRLDQVDLLLSEQSLRPQALEETRLALQARLGEIYRVIYPASQGERVAQMLDNYQLGLSFASYIALFVGAFLIYNAFGMTVIERTHEVGMLRTVGMTRLQVTRQIMSEATLLALVGTVLGLGFGVLLAEGLTRAMQPLLGQDVGRLAIPLGGAARSVVVGLGVTLLAAAVPAVQAGRISPLEALRIRGNVGPSWLVNKGWRVGLPLLVGAVALFFVGMVPSVWQYTVGGISVLLLCTSATFMIPGTVGLWERFVRPLVRRAFGNEGSVGSANIRRARLRTSLTVTALVIGVAMIIAFRGMTSSFKRDLREWINAYIAGDLYVFSDLELRGDLAGRIESVPGVAAVAPARYFEVNWLRPEGSERISFMAVDPASYRRVTSFVFAPGQGRPADLMDSLGAGETVFVSSVMSEMYDLKQGDTMLLQTRRGEQVFRVGAVVVDYFNSGYVVEGSWEDMRRYFGIDTATALFVQVQPGEDVRVVAARIETLYGQRRQITVGVNEDMRSRAVSLSALSFAFFDVLSLIAVFVAALGVVNTMTMNVMERTREIGMLRSIGMTRRQIKRMILSEASVMGLIGGLVGLVFGFFLLQLFTVGMNRTRGGALTLLWPIPESIIGFVIAIVVSLLAAQWPARRAARLNIIDALHTE